MDKRVEITYCPICSSRQQKYRFHDWQGNRFVECKDCGLVFQNPYSGREYEEDYWGEVVDPDGVKRNVLLERDSKLRNWYGDIVSFINGQNAGKILDVGCGPGFLLSAIDDKHEKWGVELSNICIKYIENNWQGINVSKSLLDDSSFPTEHFDIVVLYHLIEHLIKPLELLTTVKRIMKKDGIIIVGTPNIESFCAKRFQGNFRLLDRGHLNMFSEKTLTMALNKLGFRIIKKEYPFFKTDYFTVSNLIRLYDRNKISPPFYGNIMTFYARKMV